MWEQLITLLVQMVKVYKGLLIIGNNKRSVLIAGDVHSLEKIIQQEEMLIYQAGKLEALRYKIVREIASLYGINKNDINQAELIKLADPDSASKLDTANKELGQLITELKPINEINTQLIKQALNIINYNVNLLTQEDSGVNYAPQGAAGKTVPARPLLDCKV